MLPSVQEREIQKTKRERDTLVRIKAKLIDAIISSNCHGSATGIASGKLKKDIQEQARTCFKAVSKYATKGFFTETKVDQKIRQNNGFENHVTVVRGINKEFENLRNKEKWVIIEESWGKKTHEGL